MTIIFLLIIVSIVVATGFLALFIWATRSGQFDDTLTPAMRMLFDDSRPAKAGGAAQKKKPGKGKAAPKPKATAIGPGR